MLTLLLLLLQISPDVLTANITPPSFTNTVPVVITLTGKAVSSYGYSIVSWSWDYGDGFTCISPNYCGQTVVHYYNKVGTYNVKFTATDNHGTTGSTYAIVTVTTPCNLPPICKGGLLPNKATASDLNTYMQNNVTTGCRFTTVPRCAYSNKSTNSCSCSQPSTP